MVAAPPRWVERGCQLSQFLAGFDLDRAIELHLAHRACAFDQLLLGKQAGFLMVRKFRSEAAKSR